MPDGKITRQKIRDHFRRLWLAYLIGILAAAFLNNLIFTVTRPSFSDDETLKIMLLNVQAEIEEDLLLETLRDQGILSVQTEPLAGADPDDPSSVMMLSVQLTSGFGDLYLTDPAGLALLENRAACLDLSGMDIPGTTPVSVTHPETGECYPGALQTLNGYYLVIPFNSTNIPQAKHALPAIVQMITE